MAVLLISSITLPSAGNQSLYQTEYVVVYAMPYDFSEYSPFTANSYATAQWQSTILSGLYKRSTTFDRDWIPDLAASLPVIDDDQLIFTIDLKEGLQFSNGDPLTADDVVFSFLVAINPMINTNFYPIYPGLIDEYSVIKTGDLQVQITFYQTYAFPFGILSTPIIPQEVFEADYNSCVAGVAEDCVWNNPDLSDIISAGPFKASSYDDTNQVVTVVKNSKYHGWENGEAQGNLDKIVFKKTTEKQAAIAELAAGDIDILDSQYIPGIDELSFLPDIVEVFVGDPAHQEVALNHLHPYFGTGEEIPGNTDASDAEMLADALLVRRAMSHAMNRNYAVNEIMEGLAQPAATAMPSASLGWDSALLPRAFDIELAKSIMEQAGFDYESLLDEDSDGIYETFFFEFTVLSPNTSVARNLWDSMWVNDLKKIGIGVTEYIRTGWTDIIPRTFGYAVGNSLVPLYDDGGYDVLFVGYGWGLDWNPQGLYDSDGSHLDGGGGNFYNFDLTPAQIADKSLTSDVEEIVADYLSTLDFTTRIEIVQDLQAELHQYIPVIAILYPQSHWGMSTSLVNIDPLLLSVSALEWDQVTQSDSSVITEDPVITTDPPNTSNPQNSQPSESNPIGTNSSGAVGTTTDDFTFISSEPDSSNTASVQPTSATSEFELNSTPIFVALVSMFVTTVSITRKPKNN